MRWLIAGLLFALAVTLAIGTAAIHAENVCARRRIEHRFLRVEDRIVEFERLSLQQVEAASPQRLAALYQRALADEAQRREARLQ